MPPLSLEDVGCDRAAEFNANVTFRFRNGRTYDLVLTRANAQLAFGAYVRDPAGGPGRASGLRVLTLSGNRVAAITRFENSVLPRFGLPPTLPARDGPLDRLMAAPVEVAPLCQFRGQ